LQYFTSPGKLKNHSLSLLFIHPLFFLKW